MKPYSIFLILALLAMACQPEEFHPIPADEHPVTENWEFDPDQLRPAGFILERPERSSAMLFVDRETDYTVVISTDPLSACGVTPRPTVGVLFPNDQLDFSAEQVRSSTSSPQHLHVTVYDQAYAPDETWCDFSKEVSAVASGIIAFEHVSSKSDCDNEVCAHRTHTYYFSATGTLTAEDGTPVRLAVQYHRMWPVDAYETTHTEEITQVRME